LSLFGWARVPLVAQGYHFAKIEVTCTLSARWRSIPSPILSSYQQLVEVASSNGENVLLVGPTGTGKSHLAQGLACEAIKRGYRVLYRPLQHLVDKLYASRADGTFRKVYNNILPVCRPGTGRPVRDHS